MYFDVDVICVVIKSLNCMFIIFGVLKCKCEIACFHLSNLFCSCRGSEISGKTIDGVNDQWMA